ncbi:bifunctional 5,10-methylenetetrahydrofolate dehydrogenase/5,10-methenyltetrahydrofolate cyclohydrolase [Candidatus Acetothermia bacterium]|nr:bifunctional 5,10-methylenetetrahydrofolate dehydrogenase/5,10-methenyltetrahydrofolate cyclohydrolase [Candidatus Acetothermia bacterium]MBI3643164.1 bifunctional 5,10-methylenetetrahydrofolate dehydrogenase/5,10-methenyltetrahydrofolate cyclohydrolase [Candidatus Acetothermia bacterium]
MSTKERVIDGRAIAKGFQSDLREEIESLKKFGIFPKLAVVWVGDDPASGYYFRAKEKLAGELGMGFEGLHLQKSTNTRNLIAKLGSLNQDITVHGILVEFPLPEEIDSRSIQDAIAPEKDVDGVTLISQGKLFAGKESFIPATPYGVIKLLEACEVELQGKHAVVLGRGEVVGKPLAMLLLKANATVTICHSRTKDLKRHTLQADVLCAAVGVPHLVTEEMIKPGAAVIDIGYNALKDGTIVGDVDFEKAKGKAGLITPVKGGVGAMTATMIMANTIQAAKAICSK